MAGLPSDGPHSLETGHWASIVESLDDGVVVLDEAGELRTMNQAAEAMLGCSRTVALGHPHGTLFAHSPWISRLVVDAASGHVRGEGAVQPVWGAPIRVRISASPIIDATGRRTGTVLLLRDLSLQKDLEEDQIRARSIEDLGGIVSALAHEIKNPLGGIRGAAQLLSRELPREADAQENVTLVLREVDRLKTLLERLLALGPRRGLPMGPVNVHQAIEHVLALMQPEAADFGVAWRRAFDPSLPPVRGHEDSVIQVLLNLVRNAVDALRSKGSRAAPEIRITTRIDTGFHRAPDTRRTHRMLRVDVEDNGPGIPAEIRSNLFSPFVTGRKEGTGLGLAISQRIVSDHEGTIRVDSEPGRTRFRVLLPEWVDP